MSNKTETLRSVIDRVIRFPHNVNLAALVREVYGKSITEDPYVMGKYKEIVRRGFAGWWSELDLENQRKVTKIMIQRYPDLPDFLR